LKPLDKIDKEILNLLRENGRLPYRSIAYKIGMEGSTVRKRVKRLVEKGVIRRFTIEVNTKTPTKKKITAFITVFPSLRYSEEIKKRLIVLEEVTEWHHLAGRCGMLLKTDFHNVRDLNDFIEKMKRIPGVAGIRLCRVAEKLL